MLQGHRLELGRTRTSNHPQLRPAAEPAQQQGSFTGNCKENHGLAFKNTRPGISVTLISPSRSRTRSAPPRGDERRGAVKIPHISREERHLWRPGDA